MNSENYQHDLQGARVTITTNILNVSKLMEIHLITKKHTIFTPFAKPRICSSDLFDLLLPDPVTIFTRLRYRVHVYELSVSVCLYVCLSVCL